MEIVEGWPLRVVGGAWVALCPRDTDVTVSLNEDGSGFFIEDSCRYYPSGRYDIPFRVLDRLRALSEEL